MDGRLACEVADEISGDKLVCQALVGYVSCIQDFINPLSNEVLVCIS